MKLFLILNLFSLISYAEAPSVIESQQSGKKEVELQWSEDSDAKNYHIEIYNSKKELVKNLNPQKASIKFKGKPGKYQLRVQIRAKDNRLGPWSEWLPVEIKPLPPKEGDLKFSLREKSNIVRMTVEGILFQSDSMVIEIRDLEGKLLKSFNKKNESFSFKAPPGEYQIRAKIITEDGLASKEFILSKSLQIHAQELNPPLIAAEVTEAGQLQKFDIEVRSGIKNLALVERQFWLTEDWSVYKNKIDLSKGPVDIHDFPPGKFRIIVWSEASGFLPSKKQNVEFVKKPTFQDLE